jgi:NAD(P)-dependent dehydrogenase (short-subunit alcohol dehydrogenase family)
MVAQTVDAFGGVDILVNNAAIAIYRLLVDYTDDEWDCVTAVNLRGIFLASRRCIPIMAQRGGGSIISIASVHARTTATNNAPYVASKGAVVALTRAMALEGAPHKIRVNCILPGAIATPMLLENWGDVPPDQNPLMPRIPLQRFGDPDEIARVAQFLASDDASYMTGSDVLVDGGLSAHFS